MWSPDPRRPEPRTALLVARSVLRPDRAGLRVEDEPDGRLRWGVLAAAGGAIALLLLNAGGCITQDMADQPSYRPFEASSFFADGLSARHPPAGTVARGAVIDDPHLTTGRVDGEHARVFPFPIGAADLERGRERFLIFCSPCHDAVGTGRGIVQQRGFRGPRSYHSDRLRAAPPGHFFDVMTHGMGLMPRFDFLIPPADRWRIVAWIRVLQLSQHAPVEWLPPDDRARLEEVPR